MFADALNPIIAKKSMKENWKIKGKIIYPKKKRLLPSANHCKQRRDNWIKERIKMKNNN